ncbi:helix-turn-helix domain-containing protein [Streptomyces sp. NPDC048483]|uniref:helix-turn-helix domain-containing protein n=1 Tax=Streptomyces sp. NPDC048483 TaxID=3154927 RepID=UPI003413AAB8
MREHDDAVVGGPIGAHLASWRRRRGVTRDALAARTRLDAAVLADLETGRDWGDRRGLLATLATALRLDISELTGQPYPPSRDEHATVRAVAFHLRRQLAAGARQQGAGHFDRRPGRPHRGSAGRGRGR